MTIQLQNLTKSYGKKIVFENINLEIPSGSFTMLRGTSGSGKSTLLSIIGGIEPATSGRVIIDGQDVNELRGKARANFYRQQIGFIFQGFYLQPQLTIGENIALSGIFAGVSRLERAEKVKVLAELFGISEVLNHLPAEISGGQAERACIARAIFMSPKIILADEPTNNLDPENAKNIIEILKKIQQDTSATIIIASHDVAVEQYATQFIDLKDGHAIHLEKETIRATL